MNHGGRGMTPIEAVLDLAQTELDRREADGTEHRAERKAIVRFVEQFREHLPSRAMKLRGHGLMVTQSMIDKVDAFEGGPLIVAEFPTNNAAYSHRRKWIKLGYRAFTQKLGPAQHAVVVQKSVDTLPLAGGEHDVR